ncbi:hypothetical protein RYZ20_06370 [Thioclava sp. A2]|uniref:hypothetical protein n=1 Tax=Thioclava sp. FCG-A2 TaxID=3080562 RepID=UPI002955B837|nr:hypothetical protein [Thioclava sp. A2]MDV7270521.1 hypothetical protein [Thioclava sp. A2]
MTRDPNTPPPLPPEAFADTPVILEEPAHAPTRTNVPSVPKRATQTHSDDWAEVIGPDETRLWDGAPERGNRSGLRADFPLLAFIVVALIMAANAGGGMGSIVPLVMAGFVFLKLRQRRKGDARSLSSSYLLTDRAAYIRNGNAIERHPITAHMPLTLTARGVHFAFRTKGNNDDPREVPYGFGNIPDAETVYSLMLDLKRAAR